MAHTLADIGHMPWFLNIFYDPVNTTLLDDIGGKGAALDIKYYQSSSSTQCEE